MKKKERTLQVEEQPEVAERPDAPAPQLDTGWRAAAQLDTGWRAAALHAGAVEHYDDAALYDYEYRRRRDDIRWYRALARQLSFAEPPRQRPLRVLELGCGSGRLLVPLLRDGHAVLGVDRSAAMLRRCGERIAALGQAARQRGRLVRADFRALPLPDAAASDSATSGAATSGAATSGAATSGAAAPDAAAAPLAAASFPLIVCPFNGFMHLYTRQDVEACLGQVRRLLAPRGIFALDVLNPDPGWLARDPLRRWSRTRFRHPQTGEPLIYTTNHIYDAAAQVAFIRIYYEPDLARPAAVRSAPWTVQLTHRQFYPAELEALLHYNGFAIVESSGGFDGRPISSVSAEQVICARVR